MGKIEIKFDRSLGEILDKHGLKVPSSIARFVLPEVEKIFQEERNYYMSLALGTYIDVDFNNDGPNASKFGNEELLSELCNAMRVRANEDALNELKKHLYKEGAKFVSVTDSKIQDDGYYITVTYKKGE